MTAAEYAAWRQKEDEKIARALDAMARPRSIDDEIRRLFSPPLAYPVGEDVARRILELLPPETKEAP